MNKSEDAIQIVFDIASGMLAGDLGEAMAAVEAAFIEEGCDRMLIRGRMVALAKIINFK